MQKKIGLFIGLLLVIISAIRFDILIYPTLNYFGKYVFVLLLNVIAIWITFMTYGRFKNIGAIVWGVSASVIFWFISL